MLKIKTTEEIFPQIYAYTTPEIKKNHGWLKIGYTEGNVEKRVGDQTHTAQVDAIIEWHADAIFIGKAETFKDTEFHRFLTHKKFVKRRPNTEWFKISAETARKYLEEFRNPEDKKLRFSYELRDEQFKAVNLTLKYFLNGGTKFLWNAKPRFGKTLSAYDLAKRLHPQKILIVTNRPTISKSWQSDFEKFIEKRTEYKFISGDKAYKKYFDKPESKRPPIIAFESLQNLKGAKHFGGDFDKLNNFKNFQWDLLIVDESHEGVDTIKTQNLFEKIPRRWTLYLSGTPFKALANNFFSADEIFNWSYADEQRAKISWNSEATNPYIDLPKMNLFSYQLSKIITQKINRGVDIGGGHYDYAFDLNEFFSTSGGKFIHEEEVKIFLDTLTTLEKFPFTPNLRDELKHTFWLFHRIDSVKAMKKLLASHPVFSDYTVVDATGNNPDDSGIKKSLEKVKKAISKNNKTITLSVGQLTTGVTVPEWSAVFMLSNLRSAAEYMQAAFRAQNPYTYTKDGKTFRKTDCYVFDFAPERTLTIYNEFANNLNPASSNRQKNIGELLNFFPVLAEDDKGSMTPLDAEKVLSLPQKIKARAVVEDCFMSNFLFVNIGKVFGSPRLREIVNKFIPDETPNDKKNRGSVERLKNIPLDENGNVKIKTTDAKFGAKKYSDEVKNFADEIISDFDITDKQKKKFEGYVAEKIVDKFPDGLTEIDSSARESFVDEVKDAVQTVIDDDNAKNLQRSAEDEVRTHLRGFARTIPSFLMAYGKGDNLTLQNFDDNISDEIFLEVTGITKEEFHELRICFDEIIFNAAVKDFLKLKRELADYFNYQQDKDIFDYIPPQRTNQIFTPRKLVIEMVDALEKLHPNIFNDPNQKFLDLYMKSGLFIAEIVKRIFNRYQPYCNDPTNAQKILNHILTRQVYGFAPNEIIYRIVTEYIFGADITRNIPQTNFICADTSQAVITGNLREIIYKNFNTAVYILIKSKERVQKFGEVFTPVEIVNFMLDEIPNHVADINTKIFEPTFGEGVFITEILNRRLELCKNESDILTALSNIYGVELQADNVAAAKQNIHKILDDKISDKDLLQKIIDKNFLQGDFLNRKTSDGDTIFFRDWQIPSGNFTTFTIDDVEFNKNFLNLNTFVIIGNPPYQKDTKGDNKTYAAPIYHNFLTAAYDISDEVLMIHPARFLFNAGGTPKDFNKKMLADEHFKVVKYYANAAEVFDNVDIKGGVAITYRNANQNFGAVGTFTAFPELNSILHKVTTRADFQPLSKIIYSRTIYRLTDKVHKDYPDAKNNLSNGHLYDMSTNIFELIPEIFFDNKPNDDFEYLKIVGRKNNLRIYKFIRRDYVNNPEPLNKFKIFVPKSNGTGAIGEIESTPLIGTPLIGKPFSFCTETFISIGAFDTDEETNAALQYIKTKFARAMLGVLKITQDNPPETWAKVPLQNFRADSDIDWTVSVAEIDAQLYKKYNLSDEEIKFIEDNVKEMN